MSAIRIVILGDAKVGKTAVTVRFLTRRFIGEYSSDIDLLYRSTIRQEDVSIELEILDTCCKQSQTPDVEETTSSWADAFVVVYSVLSRSSFLTAKSLLETISRVKMSACVPTLLLGNKTDLEHVREVGADEGHKAAIEHGCMHFEVSAAENPVGISLAFQSLLREARIAHHQRNGALKRRKSSLVNMSKRLGAMFGKK
ncbi:unnamed protein product, partial [Lymnaea stagnalis]